ncbi:MAG: aryl-sulfate sulfotransferase [Ignavibacteriales bacterium]|nr:aryl-sulfate sulfotransferase [Ignavibacteriales bacterium]
MNILSNPKWNYSKMFLKYLISKNVRIIFLLIICTADSFPQSSFQYISPKPFAKMVSAETNIIIRKGISIDPASLIDEMIITVSGSKSGLHKGKLILADDNKTILFIPSKQFDRDELVSVSLHNGIKCTDGSEIGRLEFEFTTTSFNRKTPISDSIKKKVFDEEVLSREIQTIGLNKVSEVNDTIPSDFPEIHIDTVNNPAPGYLFLTVSRDVAGIGNYNMILDNSGRPVKYIKENHFSYDFKVQPNNLLSYGDIKEEHWYAGGGETTHKILDSNLTVVDSFRCGNGYVADSHDFQLLPNGHALLFGYDLQPIDMSKIVEGGDPGAFVAGSIVQEIDAQKNVVFEWRSWDHIPITESYVNLRSSAFDYIHINAIELDSDGNILVSCRQTSQVLKLDRTTGEIIWRLGGKQNQFTFINENELNTPNYFSFQHCVRRLANGHLSLFDNGNQHTPGYSRAVEYELDEQNKIATLVWEYRHSPDVFASSRGSVQRLPNGNTLIGWGSSSEAKKLAVTEVTPDKKVVFELSLPLKLSSYRAYRFQYFNYIPSVSVNLFDLLPNNLYVFSKDELSTGVKIKFNQINFGYNRVQVTKHNNASVKPEFLIDAPIASSVRIVVEQEGIESFNGEIRFDSTFTKKFDNPQNVVVFSREVEGQGIFKQLPTSFNSSTNELIASITSMGEFIFCRYYPAQKATTPSIVFPENQDSVNQRLPLEIRWTLNGYSTGFQLQVAKDSLFTEILLNDSLLKSSIYTVEHLNPDSKYFWRVRAYTTGGYSSYTGTNVFYTIAPYIKITSPNGGEILESGKEYYIRWNDNIMEDVKVELFKDGVFYKPIIDTTISNGSYKFEIPSDISVDSLYQLKITSIKDSLLYDISDKVFTITNATDVTKDLPGTISEFTLMQNYPNPFNPCTIIKYSIPQDCFVSLKVYNILGKEMVSLVNKEQNIGNYTISFDANSLSSGIYFYHLQAGKFSATKKLSVIK